jgi:thioredoxin-like negative regulator of GroEL
MNLKSILPAVALLATTAFAATPKITDVNEALSKAQTENKMVFMQYGREACGNCQALKAMIKGGKVHLSPSKFVYADVNCDDSATKAAFSSKFKVSGNTLPFVVIAAPDGRQLAGRSGYGSDADFNKLIKDAEKALKK